MRDNHKIVQLINYVLWREDLWRSAASNPRALGFDLVSATSLHGQRNPHRQIRIVTFLFDVLGFIFEDVIIEAQNSASLSVYLWQIIFTVATSQMDDISSVYAANVKL
jgi:hypothetical protein